MVKAREATGQESTIAIVRMEQISPFPYDQLRVECDKYKGAELYWAQEEHKNMGAWPYVMPRFQTLLDYARRVHYAGESRSATVRILRLQAAP